MSKGDGLFVTMILIVVTIRFVAVAARTVFPSERRNDDAPSMLTLYKFASTSSLSSNETESKTRLHDGPLTVDFMTPRLISVTTFTSHMRHSINELQTTINTTKNTFKTSSSTMSTKSSAHKISFFRIKTSMHTEVSISDDSSSFMIPMTYTTLASTIDGTLLSKTSVTSHNVTSFLISSSFTESTIISTAETTSIPGNATSVRYTISDITSTVDHSSKAITTIISSLIKPTVSLTKISSSESSSAYQTTSTRATTSIIPLSTTSSTAPTIKPLSSNALRTILVIIIILLFLLLLCVLYLTFIHNTVDLRKHLWSIFDSCSRVCAQIRHSVRQHTGSLHNPTYLEIPYTPVAIPIPIENFPNYVENISRNNNHLLEEEFKVIQNGSEVHAYTTEGFSNPDNQSKNRYGNIKAYDHSRVRLKPIEGKPGSDYINANFIDGYEQEQSYIGAQGPLESTCSDFWRMCWERNVPTIIMLTRTIEKEKLKCHQYWSEEGSVTYEPITVILEQSNIAPNYEERTFKLLHQNFPGEDRFIKHFFFVAWPDHGTPCPHQLLMFLTRVNQMCEPSKETPTLVHCSAGVGRTGTYIVLDVNMRRIRAENNIDIYSYLRRIRSQRNYMVQTSSQYVFTHQCLLQYLQTSSTQIQVNQLRDVIKYLQDTTEDGSSNIELEFRMLQNFDRSNNVRTIEVANASVNRNKNRFLNILPYDETRVKLGVGQLTNVPDIANYINASYVHGYSARYQFVATQAPLPHTFSTFWKMVLERFCPIIVYLSDKEDVDSNKIDRYWPVSETVVYEQMMIDCVSEERQGEDLSLRQLRVTDIADGRTRVVKHFHHIGSMNNNSSKSAESMIKLVGSVQQSYQENPTGNIIVHCTSGVGRTAVFIGLHNIIEQVKVENVIDVFSTVMELRYQRPSMVQTADQYMFCYLCLQHYLDSFDIYQNAI